MADDRHVGARLLDIHWGDANITKIDWATIHILFDEEKALNRVTNHGRKKEKQRRIREYQEAARAYRQLTAVLRSQGLEEDATRYAYRAQKLQRVVLRKQRKFGSYIFSLFLDILAGYGYRPGRSVFWYLVIIAGFAIAYNTFGHLPLIPDFLSSASLRFMGVGFSLD